MPTTVSSEPEPVKLGRGHGDNPAEDRNPPLSDTHGKEKRTSRILPSGLRERIEKLFEIDLRTLALTRITTALLVLVDLLWRSTSLTAFYSDRGLVPRTAIYERLPNSWQFSLHFMSGRTEIQALLFVISGILALMLLGGYRTRTAAFWSWLLFTSLNSRDFYVVHGGDALLNMLLFWGMFVPWGAKYSIDSALNSSSIPQPKRVVSIGTAALLLQVPLVYFFGGILKNGPEWRDQFTAIYYVLSAPDYATSLGHWMRSWPMPILKAITASTIVLEISGAILLFSPFATRTIRSLVLPAFLLLQIGFLLTMRLGLFPLISTAALLPFIPSRFWDKLSLRMRTPSRSDLRIYYDGNCAFCRKMALLIKEFCLRPETFVEPAQDSPDINADMQRQNSWVVIDHQNRRHYKFEALTYIFRQSPLFWLVGNLLSWSPLDRAGKFFYEIVASNRGLAAWLMKPLTYRPVRVKQPLFLSLLCAFFLGYVLLDNLGSVKRTHLRVPEKLAGIGEMLKIHQRWRMFAPGPLKVFDWYRVEGRLRNGQELCIVNGLSIDCRQPDNDIPLLRNYRWRTYWRYVGSDREKGLRPYLRSYLCYSWNGSHPEAEQLDELAIYKLRRPLPVDGSLEQPERFELWKGQCFAKEGAGGLETE
jgi:predicted DCC family thiol-disulfide oxidoreductase YuxK